MQIYYLVKHSSFFSLGSNLATKRNQSDRCSRFADGLTQDSKSTTRVLTPVNIGISVIGQARKHVGIAALWLNKALQNASLERIRKAIFHQICLVQDALFSSVIAEARKCVGIMASWLGKEAPKRQPASISALPFVPSKYEMEDFYYLN